MVILKKYVKILSSLLLGFLWFFNCNSYVTIITDSYGGISCAIEDSDVKEVESYLKRKNNINEKDGKRTPFERAIISFKKGHRGTLKDKFSVLELLLDANAIIDENIVKLVEDITDEEIKLKVLDLLDYGLLKLGDTQKAVRFAIAKDRIFVVQTLLQSGGIKLENAKELYEQARECGSKKVGKLFLNVLKIIEGNGRVSKSGISTWSPINEHYLLPIELIHHIARSIN